MNSMTLINPIRGSAADVGGAGIPMLRQYWNIVWNRRLLIITIMAVTVAAGLILTLLAAPQYTAKSRIEVAREQANITSVQGVQPEEAGRDLEFYATQNALLVARSLAERVARQLNLSRNDAFFEAHNIDPDTVQEGLGATPGGAGLTSAQRRQRLVVDTLLKHVSAEPVRGSALFDISYTSGDPALSRRIADTWVRQFIQSNLDRRFASTADARQFLERRLEDLRTRLETSERQLVGYAAANDIVRLDTSGTGRADRGSGVQTLASVDLQSMNNALADATANRVAAESALNAARARGISEGSLTNLSINNQRSKRAEIAGELAGMLAKFEPDYPPVKALKDELATLDASIAREEQRAVSVVQTTYEAAVQRERALRSRVESRLNKLNRQERALIQFNIYQRDVDTNRELYNGLLQRYKEIGVAGVGANNVSIVDPAEMPVKPSSPNLILNLFLTTFLGFGIGLLTVLIIENLDETVIDPSTVAAMFDVSLLGTTPVSDDGDHQVQLGDPKSSIYEAYFTVGSNLAFSTDHGIPRAFMVTSTVEAEGKSTTSMALAIVLSRLGRKVVLVDGDMRRPAMHANLGLTNAQGLSNFLAGDNSWDDLMQRSPIANIDFMSAGPQPPSAAELLSSERLQKLVEMLAGKYDHVVVDSPPMLGLADATLIARSVEGVVYVVESERVAARGIVNALQRLRDARGKVLGIVLTKYKAKHSGYGYGYGYGYGRDEETQPAKAISTHKGAV